MTLAIFLELVEIRTKLASLFPFLLGVLYAGYYFEAFNPINTVLFFVAMLVFDMATTAINNTMDYVKAKNLAYRDEENIIGIAGLNVKKVTLLIIGMITFVKRYDSKESNFFTEGWSKKDTLDNILLIYS